MSKKKVKSVCEGFELFVKTKIIGYIIPSMFSLCGHTDVSSVMDRYMNTDNGTYDEIVDGLYRECFPQIMNTIKDVVVSNFECLKKVS